MRVTREKLIFYALSVLVAWSKRAGHGPVRPDIGVRLALAFLFACGKSGDRRTYDEFWKLLSDPGIKDGCQNDYIRKSYCDSCIKGMIGDVGAPHTADFWFSLSDGSRTDLPSSEKLDGD